MTPPPLRVLFVTHAFPRQSGDAAGAFVLALAQAVQREGVEVRVLAPSAPGLAPVDTIDGIRVQRYRYAPRAWETLAYVGTMAEQVSASVRGKLALALMSWRGRRAARAVVRAWRPDLVHAHWWFPSGMQGGGHGVPMVVTMHGSDVRLMRTAKARALFGRVAAQSAALFAVSGWLARQARDALGGRPVGTAPMPAATSLFTAPALDAHERGRMLFVGRLNAQKGLDDLLQAMARARKSWTLDVVGDGPDRAALERRAIELGVAERVQWLGHLPQTELAPLYGRSAALVIPSTDEGLGLVGVEAALCETPAIAYASGGLTDVVQDGVTGWLVPAGDIAALAHAIDGVVDRPPKARAAGAAARVRALAVFSPDAVGARYRQAYDAALGARP
ncbi:MAG: glycosyltransferase [Gemmatimonadetes bacterium]|nr:glycosyltransferase [Gemmatimonadota bacterium]